MDKELIKRVDNLINKMGKNKLWLYEKLGYTMGSLVEGYLYTLVHTNNTTTKREHYLDVLINASQKDFAIACDIAKGILLALEFDIKRGDKNEKYNL